MKIVFYSPYLPQHFGGGEKYLFDTALTYATKHQVLIALGAKNAGVDLGKVKEQYQEFLGQDLASLQFIIAPLGEKGRALRTLWWTRKFDVLYLVTDGSAFLSWAKRNIMHIQVPLILPRKKGWEKMKFNCFQVINTNSYFTKKVVEKHWGVKVNLVCQPGIKTEELALPKVKKEKIILHVGRFFDNLHTKNQHLLVNFWRHLWQQEKGLSKGWRLVLIGGVESESYFNKVRRAAEGCPVEILTNLSREELNNYYRKSSIYWHATGFFERQEQHPERMEHFGISTVEAMAAGCAPIVISKGGQKEILGKDLDEWGWQSEAECLALTKKLMQDKIKLAEVGETAKKRAEKFSLENFTKKCWQMIEQK
jgi:glycosyltransferase involved in cell wall biosynthesis